MPVPRGAWPQARVRAAVALLLAAGFCTGPAFAQAPQAPPGLGEDDDDGPPPEPGEPVPTTAPGGARSGAATADSAVGSVLDQLGSNVRREDCERANTTYYTTAAMVDAMAIILFFITMWFFSRRGWIGSAAVRFFAILVFYGALATVVLWRAEPAMDVVLKCGKIPGTSSS